MASIVENTGRNAPHGPIPPLNSFQIAFMTPRGVALTGPFGSKVTASSSDAMGCELSDTTNM